MPIRKIPKNYRHLTGYVKSRTNGGLVAFESPLERDFYILLDADPSVRAYEEQPVTIVYAGEDGSPRTYTPDVLIQYHGRDADSAPPARLCEIKHRDNLREEWPSNKRKYRAAIRYAKDRGWRFEIVTEREIRTTRLENIKFLRRYRDGSIDPESRRVLLTLVDEHPGITPHDLLSQATDDQHRRAVLTARLWQLVVRGEIGCNLDQPITMRTALSRGAS